MRILFRAYFMQHFMVTENVLFSAAESNSCSLYFVTADGKADRSVWVWHCFPVCCTQLWKVSIAWIFLLCPAAIHVQKTLCFQPGGILQTITITDHFVKLIIITCSQLVGLEKWTLFVSIIQLWYENVKVPFYTQECRSMSSV